MRGVSPIPLKDLGFRGQMLLRPAALLNQFARMNRPLWIKTHFANFQPDGGLPHCIPKDFTTKALYVVRDPRSVVLSFAKFFQFSIETAVENMNNKDFTIGGTEQFASVLVSSWSNHVASWTGESEFPVHVVKYEDMLEDAGKELTEVLEFLDIEVNAETVAKAVEATKISKLSQEEKDNGFREHSGKGRQFFSEGGIRWQDELGPRWIRQIEQDHEGVMRLIGYLDNTQVIKAVS